MADLSSPEEIAIFENLRKQLEDAGIGAVFLLLRHVLRQSHLPYQNAGQMPALHDDRDAGVGEPGGLAVADIRGGFAVGAQGPVGKFATGVPHRGLLHDVAAEAAIIAVFGVALAVGAADADAHLQGDGQGIQQLL